MRRKRQPRRTSQPHEGAGSTISVCYQPRHPPQLPFSFQAMLFKPLSELPTPRHIVQDREIQELYHTGAALPVVRVVLTENHTQTLLVAPILLKVLLTALPLPQTVVGTVTVLYPEIAPPASKGEEYSIHEQLYQPAPESSPSRTTTFDLHSAGDSYVYMLVPYFEDAVVYHLIAEELAASWHPARVVAMAPAYMNNNQSLGKLVSSKVFASPLLDEVAALTPPLCFTGPAAAVTAAFSNTPTLALVLNAEGNSGFEKISPDTMIDACLVVASVMGLDALASTAYMRTVSTAVRKSFGGVSSSSGMYL